MPRPSLRNVQVPTMDEFNALKAQVDNHETRITALEHTGGGTTVSPDGTTVTDTTGVIIDGDGRKFKLTAMPPNNKIDCDGNQTGGNVVRLYAKNRMCYQENASHNWWYAPLGIGPINSNDKWVATSNPTGTTPVGDAPAQAKAAGFNQRTLGPGITMDKNWFPWTGRGNLAGSGLTVNADGTIYIRGGDGNNWNAQLSSCIENAKPPKPGDGVIYGGGGYFECIMRYDNPAAGWYQGSPGWPAWWGGCAEAGFVGGNPLNPPTNIECDFLESMTKNSANYSHGLIQWWNGNMGGAGQANPPIDSTCQVPAGTRSDQFHKYGWLWVMATDTAHGYAQAYFDDIAVGPKYEWTKYKPGDSENNVSGLTRYSATDRQHLQLLIGTGPQNPMTVKEVSVWQANANSNMGSYST